MTMFKLPTKADVEVAYERAARDNNVTVERNEKFAEQMDRLTNDQLTALGFTTEEVNYLRSAATSWKYQAKYFRHEDLTGYVDDPSYAVNYFLNIRNF